MLRYIGSFEKLTELGFERMDNRLEGSDYFHGYKKIFRKFVDYGISGLSPVLQEEAGITIHDEDSVCYEREICVFATDTCKIERLKTPTILVYNEVLDFLYELTKAGLIEKMEEVEE